MEICTYCRKPGHSWRSNECPVARGVQERIARQNMKRDKRIQALAAYGIKATVADINGVRIGAGDLDKILRALRAAGPQRARRTERRGQRE